MGRHADTQLVDLPDRLNLPRFVDCHLHLPQYGAIGLYGRELLKWLESFIFPAERNFTPTVAQDVCPVFFNRLFANGITTAAIYTSVQQESADVAFEWALESALRGIIGKVMIDCNSPSFLQEKTTDSLKGERGIV